MKNYSVSVDPTLNMIETILSALIMKTQHELKDSLCQLKLKLLSCSGILGFSVFDL